MESASKVTLQDGVHTWPWQTGRLLASFSQSPAVQIICGHRMRVLSSHNRSNCLSAFKLARKSDMRIQSIQQRKASQIQQRHRGTLLTTLRVFRLTQESLDAPSALPGDGLCHKADYSPC